MNDKPYQSKYKIIKETNQFLKNEISKYEYLEKFERQNIYCSKHLYGETYYKRLPLSFINTSFYFYSNELYPLVNYTFEDSLINRLLEKLYTGSTKSTTLSFAMLCIGIEPTKEGPILILEEPFKTLYTKPLSKTPLKIAKTWINRVLIVDLTISSDAIRDNEFEVVGVKRLKLTKHGRMIDDTEHLFSWGSTTLQLAGHNQFKKCFNCDKRILEIYKKATGRDECLAALDQIEHLYLYSKQCLIPPFRINKNALWIRFEYESMGIFYHNNVLEFVYQPKEDINTLYNPDGSFGILKNAIYRYRFRDNIFNHTNEFLTTDEYIISEKEYECGIHDFIYEDLLRIYR